MQAYHQRKVHLTSTFLVTLDQHLALSESFVALSLAGSQIAVVVNTKDNYSMANKHKPGLTMLC